jgi:hypothetical protein
MLSVLFLLLMLFSNVVFSGATFIRGKFTVFILYILFVSYVIFLVGGSAVTKVFFKNLGMGGGSSVVLVLEPKDFLGMPDWATSGNFKESCISENQFVTCKTSKVRLMLDSGTHLFLKKMLDSDQASTKSSNDPKAFFQLPWSSVRGILR